MESRQDTIVVNLGSEGVNADNVQGDVVNPIPNVDKGVVIIWKGLLPIWCCTSIKAREPSILNNSSPMSKDWWRNTWKQHVVTRSHLKVAMSEVRRSLLPKVPPLLFTNWQWKRKVKQWSIWHNVVKLLRTMVVKWVQSWPWRLTIALTAMRQDY